MFKQILVLLRPKQWLKNAFVFAVLVFSQNLFDARMFLQTLLGAIAFCLVSSCVYIINDIVDRDKDRLHPKKCKRPIASGSIGIRQAVILLGLLCLLAFGGGYFVLNIKFNLVILTYFVLNLAYSLALKNIPILDTMCIAFGFVLRALSGSFLIDVDISPWLVLCTLFLSLFLAIHKRKSEIQSAKKKENLNEAARKVFTSYNAEMLRDMSSVMDSATIMAYSLYCINTDEPIAMLITVPFVVFGIFRYQLISYNLVDMTETPEVVLLKDKPLLVDIFMWGVLCIGILYLI
jgi:4-hydroxybenzoate polyprenyltransferase